MSKIPVCEPLLDGNEDAYVQDCLKTNWISSAGRYITDFERSFGARVGAECVACSNGTTAIHLAMAALGIGPGDEVVIPDFTLIVSASMVVLAGARPVLVDVDPFTACLDADQVEAAVTPRTKAIMAVHMYGHPFDVDPIREIARRHGLFVIEDGAQAHGATYKGREIGGLCDVGVFSLYGNKIITSGEGGMLTTPHAHVAERARVLRNQAFEPPRFTHRQLGFNYRLTNVQAAIALAQLERLDQKVARKREIAAVYEAAFRDLPGIQLPVERAWAKSVYWMYGLVLDPAVGLERTAFRAALDQAGVDTRDFFHPMHLQPVFTDGTDARYPKTTGAFPQSERLGTNGFYLPSGLGLTEDQLARVVAAVRQTHAAQYTGELART